MTFFFGFVGARSSAASAAVQELEGSAEASMSLPVRDVDELSAVSGVYFGTKQASNCLGTCVF